jgi:monodehydroascorbate reductase (NADH)
VKKGRRHLHAHFVRPSSASTQQSSSMSPSVAKKIVVVGGGVSAGYFARAMVAANAPGAALTIISSENVAPYERPALTKAVLHAESPARLPGFHTSVGGGGERQTEEWYTEKGITLKLGTTVVGWDKANQTVTTDAGDVTSYDKLVVAIGCTALKLPASIGGGLSGVHYVRNNADALALAEAMSTAKKQPVVIGGGYIGLEVSAALAARVMNPRVVLMEPHVMARLWNSEIAQKYEQFFETKGVAFYRNAKVKAINAGDDGAVASVTLADGEVLETDLVVVGVGAGENYAPFDGLDSTPDPRSPGGIAVDGMFCASGAGVADKTGTYCISPNPKTVCLYTDTFLLQKQSTRSGTSQRFQSPTARRFRRRGWSTWRTPGVPPRTAPPPCLMTPSQRNTNTSRSSTRACSSRRTRRGR